ncbi:TPA: hypothetical protein ACX6RO_001813 [Photobacterium damselae]
MSMKAQFQSADQNWQNGSTTYWFDVTFDVFNKTDDEWESSKMVLGVVESGTDEPKIVNDESDPIEGYWFEAYVSDLILLVTDEIRQASK